MACEGVEGVGRMDRDRADRAIAHESVSRNAGAACGWYVAGRSPVGGPLGGGPRHASVYPPNKLPQQKGFHPLFASIEFYMFLALGCYCWIKGVQI